jgi:hypothetical protein
MEVDVDAWFAGVVLAFLAADDAPEDPVPADTRLFDYFSDRGVVWSFSRFDAAAREVGYLRRARSGR